MKKILVPILILMFSIVSCSSSKKIENDTDLLPDEDTTNTDTVDNVDEDDELNDADKDAIEDMDPCDPNPCVGIENSTEECTADAEKYFCGCVENYFWDGIKCVDPCAGIDCIKFNNAYGSCKPKNAFAFSCDCGENLYWLGKEKGCGKPSPVNVCTGQTKCYDMEKEIECPAGGGEFFGQDAQYAKLGYCVPQSFSIDDSVNDEPVVVDNNLGLMWQRNIPPTEELYIEDVKQYCEDLVYGGYDDWRLPSFEELITISDYGRYDPALDTGYFPDSGSFWTSTENEIMELIACYPTWRYQVMILSFKVAAESFVTTRYVDQWIFEEDKKYSYSFDIRCVRGESATKPEYYFISETLGKNIIWNNINDLILIKTKATPIIKHTWSEALEYCSELDYAGISDWRLANVKELAMNPWDESFVSESHTSTTRVDDFRFDYQHVKDAEPIYTFCVANDPCGTELFWNGEKCSKNPCSGDPCKDIYLSDEVCIVVDEETYACGCTERYAWNPDKKECLRTCADYPCQSRDNSDHKCYPDDNYGYTCGCNENFYWNPEKKECLLDCGSNPCKNYEHSDGECHLNGTEESYCGCVEGYRWFYYDCVEDLCNPNPCENIANSDRTCEEKYYKTNKGYDISYRCNCIEGYYWNTKYEECRECNPGNC